MLSHLAHAESKPDDNAALQYWRAFAMMPTLDDYSRPRIDMWDTLAINDSLRSLLATYTNAFHLAHLGAAKPRCDWGVSMDVDGPFTLLPFLARGRDLSRAMLLQASPTSSRASRTRACTSAGRSGGTSMKWTAYPMESSGRAARLDGEDRDAPPLPDRARSARASRRRSCAP